MPPRLGSHKAQEGLVDTSLVTDASLALSHAPWGVFSEEHLDSHPCFLWPKPPGWRPLSRWTDPMPCELRFPAVDVENIHRSRKLRQGSLAHGFHFLYKKYEKSSLLSASLSSSDVASGKG